MMNEIRDIREALEFYVENFSESIGAIGKDRVVKIFTTEELMDDLGNKAIEALTHLDKLEAKVKELQIVNTMMGLKYL